MHDQDLSGFFWGGGGGGYTHQKIIIIIIKKFIPEEILYYQASFQFVLSIAQFTTFPNANTVGAC